ncbi:tetratricopeptide repeat protein [Fibrobacterota bacterium]
MKRNYCLLIMFLTAILLTITSEYSYGGESNDILQRNRKCVKKCTKQANLILRINCYTKYIEKNPQNPDLYYLRGETYLKVFKYNSAISDFIKVVELEPGNVEAYYLVASTASLAYKKEYALTWLQKALEAGFSDFERISEDPSLDNIRKGKGFKALMKQWDYELSSVEQQPKKD